MTVDEVRGNELLRQVMLMDREDALVGLTERAGDALALAAELSADRIRKLRGTTIGNPDDATSLPSR